MHSLNLVESFSEFKEFKNIDRPTMMRVLEEVFRTMIKKKFNTKDTENFDIIVNTDKGDLEIWHKRTIVPDGEVVDDLAEVAYSQAIKQEPDFELGEDLYEAITLMTFGRRAVLAARQTLISKILELEKDELYQKYSQRVGEIVTAEVYQIWKKELLLLDDESNELILPRRETISHKDRFKKGDTVRALVKEVVNKNNNPRIILSRTDKDFLAKLMELEVPEIFDGLITIKKIEREPGERAKVAVESYDDRVDPVGACVGMKGSRISGISRELRNENIDIINFTNNTSLLIQRSLTPARISSMEIDDDNKRVAVYLKPDQVSLAIGRGGHNINLASRLTGYKIDVYRDIEEHDFDIELAEFDDVIEPWIVERLINIGCDTALSVLELSFEELERRSDLEEETIRDVRRILREEFEEARKEEEAAARKAQISVREEKRNAAAAAAAQQAEEAAKKAEEPAGGSSTEEEKAKEPAEETGETATETTAEATAEGAATASDEEAAESTKTTETATVETTESEVTEAAVETAETEIEKTEDTKEEKEEAEPSQDAEQAGTGTDEGDNETS